MKNLKTLLLIAVLTLGFNTIQAQTKVAHINYQQLLASVPELITLNTEISKFEKSYNDDFKEQKDALEALNLKYTQDAPNQTAETNETRQLELKQKSRKLNARLQAAQVEMDKKTLEFQTNSKPIVEKAFTAIETVAKAQGFDYVIDSSALLVANGTDLLPLVKTQLGIQ